MVTQSTVWKTEKIKHEFDSSLDSYPELRAFAETAADYLDHEAGDTYPSSVVWSAKKNKDKNLPCIHAEIRDTTLGVGMGHDFTLEELKGRDRHIAMLRFLTDFLRIRYHELQSIVFPPYEMVRKEQ